MVGILARVGQGDQNALGELYDVSSSSIMGLVCRIVEDRAVAEEITLDVYSQIWRLAATYSSEKGSPITWMYMLARSRAIDHLRSRARRTQEACLLTEGINCIIWPG